MYKTLHKEFVRLHYNTTKTEQHSERGGFSLELSLKFQFTSCFLLPLVGRKENPTHRGYFGRTFRVSSCFFSSSKRKTPQKQDHEYVQGTIGRPSFHCVVLFLGNRKAMRAFL
mmetsp:Transcript_18792/g.29065  ORF Transcript_18792/g.29065 Transcript_18792/m.29065 type:complete len:113 (-) Transcript_18792:97-435(-)